MGEGMYGKDVELVCECDESRAQVICDALNAALDAGDTRAAQRLNSATAAVCPME
jgi:hypothetical protein